MVVASLPPVHPRDPHLLVVMTFHRPVGPVEYQDNSNIGHESKSKKTSVASFCSHGSHTQEMQPHVCGRCPSGCIGRLIWEVTEIFNQQPPLQKTVDLPTKSSPGLWTGWSSQVTPKFLVKRKHMQWWWGDDCQSVMGLLHKQEGLNLAPHQLLKKLSVVTQVYTPKTGEAKDSWNSLAIQSS